MWIRTVWIGNGNIQNIQHSYNQNIMHRECGWILCHRFLTLSISIIQASEQTPILFFLGRDICHMAAESLERVMDEGNSLGNLSTVRTKIIK